MNPVAKELWLTALRSGEYEQGKSYLNMNDRLCCLGVLSEEAIKSGVGVKREQDQVDGLYYYDGQTAYPPRSVFMWAGFPESVGLDTKLANMNDQHGKTFLEIADWIEENL
jgi:hypothetical protein